MIVNIEMEDDQGKGFWLRCKGTDIEVVDFPETKLPLRYEVWQGMKEIKLGNHKYTVHRVIVI